MELFLSITTAALLKLSPLLFCSLAVALAFRGGVWNIGVEGQFLVGALAATTIGVQSWNLSAWLWVPAALLAGAFAGAAWGWIAGILRTARKIPEVISTLLLNFMAVELVSFCVHGPLQESAKTYPMSDPVALNAELPVIGAEGVFHLGLVIALVLALFCFVFLFFTSGGFKVRALGQNEKALSVAGFSVNKIRLFLFMGSAALAGLGGAVEVLGVSHRLFERLSPGYGFAAIAIALLGKLHPLWILLSSLFFAFLYAGAAMLERVANVPSVVLYMGQAVVIFVVVLIGLKKQKSAAYGY